ncbi:MAG: Gfo/Idh/MocA family oxidoreductase [Planctomycetales bacterium]|nr:Gfo/Idh/MocA family oxidoreductase [Planctomycetales bacterium]
MRNADQNRSSLGSLHRRSFLRAASALSVPYFVPQSVFANAPSDRLTHACFGADGMGWSDLQSLASHPRIEIVAICDVDTDRMGKAGEKLPQARRYQDWRELLASEGDKIDSVNVSVPDHSHAPITLAALERKKHVYCQKPLTHNVAEARAVAQAAATQGVTTQMGNQIQSHGYYRTATEIVRSGLIGKVQAIHAWTGAKYTQQPRPAGADPVPMSLNWDLWLGVAPKRPFKTGLYHPFNWRCWQDFGGGALGDFGCHILDTPFKAVGLTTPLTIRAEVPETWHSDQSRREEVWPDWEIVHYEFPGTELTAGKTIPVTWYDSGKQPDRELFGFASADDKVPGSGALFIGEDGKLLLPHVGAPSLLPGSKNLATPLPQVEGFNHYHAYIDACLGQGSTGSSFDFAGPLAEATLLGTIAVRCPNVTLEWNPQKLQFTNSAEANQFVGTAK